MNKHHINLLEGKVLTTLLRLAGPLMGTAFVQMAYNLTDIAWIGRLGTDAVAAAGQIGFLIWLSTSFMLIPRVGLGVLSSQTYGRADREETKKIFTNGIFMAIVMGLSYALIVFLLRKPIIGFYRLGEPVQTLANQYLTLMSIGFVFFFINPVLSAAYNSMGNSQTPFRINTIGLISNIVLDPILIFGLGKIPAMGIRGAALATVLSQFIVFFLFGYVIMKEKGLLYYSLPFYRPDQERMKRITKLGTPAFLQSGIHAVISILLSRSMASFGAMPLAVYSVGSLIESISWMTTEGFSAGITAFVGQNFGASKWQRLHEIYRTSMRSVGVIGLVATSFLLLFRVQLFRLFIPDDPDAILLGATYLLIFGLSQFFMSIEIGATGVFNGIGDTRTPAVLSSVLNVLRLPMGLFLMNFFGVVGIWIAMSASSIIKGVVAVFLLSRKMNRLPRKEWTDEIQIAS